ncbi:MAG: glycosyltransferase family 39 protein [Anaerolineales bacterium]|nr:glycosyltransferase family 39 protein [Anaerolineales bacterium]
MAKQFSWHKTAVILLTLLALALRLWRLEVHPPGWRDDELINSLVISQKVIDGNWAVYYPDASGHEALYHILNAFFLYIYGPSAAGIRLLSVFLGTLTIPLTYAIGRRLFNPTVGLIAAAALSVSFWSLMYSRIGLRHISLPVFSLGAFYFFWRVAISSNQLSVISNQLSPKPPLITDYRTRSGRETTLPITVYCSLFTGLGFYTYFASRGVPLVMIAFCGYLALFFWPTLQRNWHWLGLTFGLSLLLALPLFATLAQQPEAEGRVSELAVPLVAARAGDFAPLREHIVTTLSMFHAHGDGEWLYNIPDRPVFVGIGSLFFWAGVVIALLEATAPLWKRWGKRPFSPHHAQACAFLLLWWLAGISPDFISVPPASLGHAILAQPAVFLLAALPVWKIGDWRLEIKEGLGVFSGWIRSKLSFPRTRESIRLDSRVRGNDNGVAETETVLKSSQSPISNLQSLISLALGCALVFAIATRDWPAYFRDWPERGMVRFLYRADIHDVGNYLNDHPELTDFGMSGFLSGPWDKLALQAHLMDKTAVFPRWYNPERALLIRPAVSFGGYPLDTTPYDDQQTVVEDVAGGYELRQTTRTLPETDGVCFANGLCWLTAVFNPTTHRLELGWQVGVPLQLPDIPLISNPPPPGVYAGTRLRVFAQLHDSSQTFLVGDDGLWVDPTTLQVGDIFVQQHELILPDGAVAETAVIGLYDPKTGERILTNDGRDLIRLSLADITVP